MNELWSEHETRNTNDVTSAGKILVAITAFVVAIGIILLSIYGERGHTVRWIHHHMSMLVTVGGVGLGLTALPWYGLHAAIKATMSILLLLALLSLVYILFSSSEYIPLYR